MSKFLSSDSFHSIQRFLEDSLFQEWVFRPSQILEDYWRDWIKQHPESKPIIKEARKVLEELESNSYRLDDTEIQDLWKKVQSQIHPKSLSVVKKPSLPKFKIAWLVASCVLVFLVLGYFLTFVSLGQITYKTGYGENLTIYLPDSSRVILNANSTLTLFNDWNSGKAREVWIDGEAFFDVKHLHSHEPFIVHPTSGVEVEVLGTRFNVYQRKNQTKVLLSEGNVTMSFAKNQNSPKILMKPGDLVEYDQKGIQKRQVNPDSYVSWTKKVLQLESTKLEDMIRMAEENYGIKIAVSPTLDLSQSASGSMPLADGTSFMRFTSRIFNVQISYKDSIYYIE